MADQDNQGQFGNREDTEEMARLGGETSGGGNRSSASRVRGAAGKTEAAKRGGKHSHSGGRRSSR